MTAGRPRARARTWHRAEARLRQPRASRRDRARGATTGARRGSFARHATRPGGGKGQVSDVTADQQDTSTQPGAPDPLAGTAEHRLRSIDAHDRDPGPAERNRDAPRSAPKFENRSAGLQGQVAPEGNVASAHRSRVLPIVERRVVVPAFVSFGQWQLPTANSQLPRSSVGSWRLGILMINPTPPVPPGQLDAY